MKILIDNGCHDLKNMGDVAMLQVAVARLKQMWPEAEFQVIAEDPHRLKKYCPDAYAVSAHGRTLWLAYQSNIFGRFSSFVPVYISKRLQNHDWPLVSNALMWMRMNFRKSNQEKVKQFLDSVLESDLVVISGGGDINDSFQGFAITLFHVLNLAIRYGKRTALVGQGVGPIFDQNSELVMKGREVLPKVDVICVRERLKGPAYLEFLNVEGSRVFVTGDDAIELAYNAPTQKLGNGIGVNLRVANYSGIEAELQETVGLTLKEAAEKYGAPLLPVPISFLNKNSVRNPDSDTIRGLLAQCGITSDGGQEMDDPITIIQQVARCRVVVTGSYHAAVFALSQGIPAMCLVKTSYYMDKFRGLSDQFNDECEIIDLNDSHVRERILNSLDKLWRSADQKRSSLLNAANKQVEIGRSAYRAIYDVVKKGSLN
jgi:colanic acid/amylovoran biosynthesis protein